MDYNATRSYNLAVAKVVGVEAAVLFHSLFLWCEYNEAHKNNFKEGRYWTYQTAQKISENFGHWNVKKVDRLVDILREAGLVETKLLQKQEYNRTRWFAINHENLHSILRKKDDDTPNMGTRHDENGDSLQIKNTNSKTNNNIIVQAQEKPCVESITTGESMHENKLFAAEPPAPAALPLPFASEQFKEAWKEWQDYRKERKLKKLLAKSQEMQFAKMKKFPERQIISMIENAIQAGYQTFIFANSVPDARFNDPNFDPMKPHQVKQQAPVSFQMTDEMRKQATEGW